MKTLAFIEIHQETNSFSSVGTTLREFENFALYRGEEVHEFCKVHKLQAYGFFDAIEKYGKGEFKAVPIIAAWAWSGGPIERDVYEQFKADALEGLKEVEDLAGIYCSLHGAMGVENLRDPESDLLRAIREIVGDDMPIGVSYDLHACVTEENIQLATFLTGYHTNPHRDHKSIGRKTTRILMDTARGKVKPTMAFRKMRLLKGGGWGIDLLQPLRGILRRMKRMEKMKGVLAVTNFWVHLWIDDEELGWSVVTVTDANQDLADELAEELAEANWAVRDRKHPQPKSPTEAIDIILKSKLRRMVGTTVICDVSDVVGAGAPGANTNILKELLDRAPELTTYIPVRDPEVANEIFPANIGDELTINVGGRIDPQFNPQLEFTGKVIFSEESQWGNTTILVHKGIHLILSELAFAGYFPRDFRSLKLNLWKADILIVKNLFPFRIKFARYNRKTLNVVSSGTTNIDVFQLPYTKIPRPIYPLDKIDDWR